MANIVDTLVYIGNDQLNYYRSIDLNQTIFEHHTFSLVIPAEYIDGKHGFLFQNSKNLIGEDFTLKASVHGLESGVESLRFRGVVTNIRRNRSNGYSGDIIISGVSSTILLDSGLHCCSWKDSTLADIINDVLGHFPMNKIKAKVSPVYKESIPYVVQYQETAWQFLKRMCATYGEWLYHDGDSLIVGRSNFGDEKELVFGSDLSAFDLSMGLSSDRRTNVSYNYESAEVYPSRPRDIESKAGLDQLGRLALEKSRKLFYTMPKGWNNYPLGSEWEMDHYTNMRSAMEAAGLVLFEGQGSHPGISLGGRLHVSGSNIYSFAVEDYGSYTPLEITHKFGMNSNYSNTFTAVFSQVKVPPVRQPSMPMCETQSAIVKANNDPQGMGRIQVRFHWMKDYELTPWVRVASPHSGGGKGMFFIPELDEEVVVAFEGGSAVKPYVVGTVYNGSATSSFANAGNDVKAIQTRSGNKIVYNDKDGSITAQDACGNVIVMDGKGNITITASSNNVTISAPETMSLNAKNLKMDIQNDMDIKVGNNKTEYIAQKTTLQSLKSEELVQDSKSVNIVKKLESIAGEILLQSSTGKMLIDANDKLTLQSKNRIDYGE